MCQTTHLKILDLVTFSDLTLTLTWAKYETISLVSTFAWSLGVHMESFGRNMLRLRSPRSATWKHPILTFDLTLTWHVTSILNFRKCFGSVSSRSFECRLVRLSTSIRFRDSRGGGVGSDPHPGCGGYRNSPGGGGLTRHRLGGGGSDPTPLGFSGITSSFITVSTWNLAHLSGHQFGVVSCKENQNRPDFFCYRSNLVTSLHAILGR